MRTENREKRKAETEVGNRQKRLKSDELVSPQHEESHGSEIKSDSVSQVPRESPSTMVEPRWEIVSHRSGGTLRLARNISAPAIQEDCSETQQATDRFLAGETILNEDVVEHHEEKGQNTDYDMEKSITEIKELWARAGYSKT